MVRRRAGTCRSGPGSSAWWNPARCPPRQSLQPSAAERRQILEWARGLLEAEARSRAGDPGRVVLRRLSNAQFEYTLRDLLGVDLQPAREFPIDGAAGEGFTNTGEALVMSPALLGKYLDAAKGIVRHAVLLPDGLRFSGHSTRRDWTDEILGRIRSFYGRYTEVRRREWMYGDIPLAIDYGQVPLEEYVRATLELRQDGAGVDEVAGRNGLSRKYLGILWRVLNGEVGGDSFLLERVRARWRSLSPQDSARLVAEIERWYEPLWRFNSVGHLNRLARADDAPGRQAEFLRFPGVSLSRMDRPRSTSGPATPETGARETPWYGSAPASRASPYRCTATSPGRATCLRSCCGTCHW